MRHWATGIAVITTQNSHGPHGMAADSPLSVSLDPPTPPISLKLVPHQATFAPSHRPARTPPRP
ncbi:flavin reductase [Streptomyces sp. MMS24-I29]|uniref:flavin reductase n=1 Tax=Streptomyces sp. MMS24-I29 TaxID=3351480 RepID=UPI003C7B9399